MSFEEEFTKDHPNQQPILREPRTPDALLEHLLIQSTRSQLDVQNLPDGLLIKLGMALQREQPPGSVHALVCAGFRGTQDLDTSRTVKDDILVRELEALGNEAWVR